MPRRSRAKFRWSGFYLQPAVGGIVLPASFWRRFAEIENVIAIKIAPFNRYRTLDVIRGVVEAGAADRITLYTGNDDHIVLDLVTPFTVTVDGKPVTVRIKGGLLGHWSVWVKTAVELLDAHPCRRRRRHGSGRTCLRSTRRSPTATRRSSMSRTTSTACICGLPRNPAASGPARRHLVPRSERNAQAPARAGDRPGLRDLSASHRRCLRARKRRALAGMKSPGLRYRGASEGEPKFGR